MSSSVLARFYEAVSKGEALVVVESDKAEMTTRAVRTTIWDPFRAKMLARPMWARPIHLSQRSKPKKSASPPKPKEEEARQVALCWLLPASDGYAAIRGWPKRTS
jgi:hypothetical protein